MADNQRHRIKNLLQKLNDEDRNSLCCLLVNCSKCGQHVNCSDVPWEEEVQLGYVRKEERCE